jgi:signal peptidase I
MNSEIPPSLAATPAPPLPQVKDKDPDSWSELAKTAVIALLLAVLIRSFLYEPFNIPSGSMLPTLQIGDYLFVSKRDYGYSKYSFPFGVIPIEDRIWNGDHVPARGDVVVFKLPSDNRTDYIKRIIGLPGDQIEVVNGRLVMNGQTVPREPVGNERVDNGGGMTVTVMRYIETLPGGVMHDIYELSDAAPLDNFGPVTVPAAHYFMMGDNRDNSRDSRVMDFVGFVPARNIVGRAEVIFFSTDGTAALWEIWRWPFAVRYDRLFQFVGPPGAAAAS